MSDLESLFALVAAIYLADCLLFLRIGSVLFRRWRKDWQINQPESLLSNAQGAVCWGNPWPIFPSSFVGCLPPCTLSPGGLLNWTPFCLHRTGRPLPILIWLNWDDVRQVEVDRRFVVVNGKRFVSARSSEEAIQLVKQIRLIKSASESRRTELLEPWIDSAMDVAGVRDRIREVNSEVGRLAVYSKMLALFLFVISPVLIFRLGLAEVGWWLLSGIYLQSSWLAFRFHQAHRRLYPEDSDERFVKVATAWLAPLSAIRSPDLLARNALLRFHPLAVAQVLCSADESRRFLGQVYRDLCTPILPDRPTKDEAVRAALEWSTGQWKRAARESLRAGHFRSDEFIAPPPRTEDVHVSYCPRCQDQFTSPEAVCVDCGNRETSPWPATAKTSTS